MATSCLWEIYRQFGASDSGNGEEFCSGPAWSSWQAVWNCGIEWNVESKNDYDASRAFLFSHHVAWKALFPLDAPVIFLHFLTGVVFELLRRECSAHMPNYQQAKGASRAKRRNASKKTC